MPEPRPTSWPPPAPRVADLEARDAERAARDRGPARARTASPTRRAAAEDLPALLRGRSTRSSGSLMHAENFYIALYDDQRRQRSTSRTTSTRSTPTSPTRPPGSRSATGNARGTTAFVLRTGRPALITPASTSSSSPPASSSSSASVGEGDWLGVPLAAEGRTLGVLVVQALLRRARRYTEADRRPAGLRRPARRHRAQPGQRDRGDPPAQRRARAHQRDRRRARQPARLRRRSSTSSASGSASCSTRSRCSSPCTTSRRGMITSRTRSRTGRASRASRSRSATGPDLARDPDRSGRCASATSDESSGQLGAINSGTDSESWLGVPILSGRRVIGVLALESVERTRSTRAPSGCSATLATSMGAALENARLFDETKRLLADADERAAELAVINEVGEALRGSSSSTRSSSWSASASAQLFDVALDLHRPARPGHEPDLLAVRPRRGRDVPPRAARARRGHDVDGHPDRPAAAGRDDGGAGRRRRDLDRRDRHAVLAGRPDHRRDRVIGVHRARGRRGRTRSAMPTSACWARSARAWASRSRTPACSTRRSGS